MSSRALKKLQANEQNIDNFVIEDESSDENEHNTGNKFSVLMGDVQESDKESDPEPDTELSLKELKVKSTKKSRKKERKRNRNKLEDKEKEENIEKSIKEVNDIYGELNEIRKAKKVTTPKKTEDSVLKVSRHHINAENEMKRIFGYKVIAESKSKKREDRSEKFRVHIVNKKDIYMDKLSIGMDIAERKEDCKYFKFVHDRSYQKIQSDFLDIVKSHNHEAVIAMLNEHPNHIDLLLQVAEIFTMTEEHSRSAKLIEKAIYIMQLAFHPQFNYNTDGCRLPYRQRENRSFYIAVFRHIINVGNKGCPRSALELCKLLLGLSIEDDPLAVSLMIDYYALRSKEYGWLIAYFDEFNCEKKLSLMPNIAFSVPMAWYFLSKEPVTIKSLNLTKDSTSTQEFMRSQADIMLQKALITFPQVLLPLLSKINVKPETDVENHDYFGTKNSNLSSSSGLKTLIDVFIARNYQLWRDPEVISWLIENLHQLLSESEDPVQKERFKQTKQCEKNYPGLPAPIFRHTFLSHLEGVSLPRLPLEYNEILSYDPIPPQDSVCDYQVNRDRNRNSANRRGAIQELLLSFLPSYDPNAEAADFDDVERDFRQILNSLREIIGNLRPQQDDDRSPDERFPPTD